MLASEKVHAVTRHSLPPAKRFDFSMVDDGFEELHRYFVPKEMNTDTKKCIKLIKDWASARNHHSSSTIERVPNDILLTDTVVQLLKVVINHDEIKPLGRWQVVAFATRKEGRLRHQDERDTGNSHLQTTEERPYCNPGGQAESKTEKNGEGWGDHGGSVPPAQAVW